MGNSQSKFFELKTVIERPGIKKRWVRIGSATLYAGELGEALACTIETVPLNWNGEFHAFPSKKAPDYVDAETTERAELARLKVKYGG